MYSPLHLSKSQLYRGFQMLDENAYRVIVHYFEKNENEVRNLDFNEFFEILVAYAEALSQTGGYHKHLIICDEIISLSIEENIITYKGEDVLQLMLEKKAISYYNMREYQKAIYIISEKLKINPYDDSSVSFLTKCFWANFPSYIQKIKAISVSCFLICALVIAIEFIVVRTLFPNFASEIELLRNIIFALGFSVLLGGHFFHGMNVLRSVRKILTKAKIKFLYGKI